MLQKEILDTLEQISDTIDDKKKSRLNEELDRLWVFYNEVEKIFAHYLDIYNGSISKNPKIF